MEQDAAELKIRIGAVKEHVVAWGSKLSGVDVDMWRGHGALEGNLVTQSQQKFST